RPAAARSKRPGTGGSTSWIVTPQQVAFAPARQDQRRLKALVDLVAQVADVDVHDVGSVLVVFVVEVFPDHRAGHDLAPMKGEELQLGELARRQVDGLAGAADDAGRRVDLQVVDAQDRVLDLVGAADEGADAGQQFFQLKRLCQVVVGPL